MKAKNARRKSTASKKKQKPRSGTGRARSSSRSDKSSGSERPPRPSSKRKTKPERRRNKNGRGPATQVDFPGSIFDPLEFLALNNRPSRRRRITPGATHFITKKTNDDLFWLVPSEEVNQILLYTLLLKAEKYGILIHEFVFMSDHFHLMQTDPRGETPNFMREFLCESAKALKVFLGTDRRIWSGERYTSTEILDKDAFDRKSAYIRLNPLEAGLTECEDWPGLTSANFEHGKGIFATRPEVYFHRSNSPEAVSLELSPPPSVIRSSLVTELEGSTVSMISPQLEVENARRRCRLALSAVRSSLERIDKLVRSATKWVLEGLRKSKGKLLGAEKACRTSRMKRGSTPFGKLNPRFATRDLELRQAAVESFRRFDREHRAAVERLRDGERCVEFPYGTFQYYRRWPITVRGLAQC